MRPLGFQDPERLMLIYESNPGSAATGQALVPDSRRDFKPLKNTKPPVGQALADEEQTRLFEMARSKPAWFLAYVAATSDFFCGLRACEIEALQWQHVSFDERRLSMRLSKTPAGWRSVTQ